jgi:hypothetical protein
LTNTKDGYKLKGKNNMLTITITFKQVENNPNTIIANDITPLLDDTTTEAEKCAAAPFMRGLLQMQQIAAALFGADVTRESMEADPATAEPTEPADPAPK